MDIITKLKKANLSGRGGGCFPTAMKWEMVKNAQGSKKYVVANGSEGEPGILKDHYILKHHPERVVNGMKIALDYLNADKGYIYLNDKYYKEFQADLAEIILELPIEVFCKPHEGGYIGGEETAVLNALEKTRIEPRLRPPYPTTHGFKGYPTLLNNIETFYDVSLIAEDKYKNERFYTIGGDCLNEGVYCYPENFTISKVLKETGNYPDFDFFVQVGGDASGEVLNSKQLSKPAGGCASITVYSMLKHEPMELITNWIRFFAQESCGQCTPCREGTYRLLEKLKQEKIDWMKVSDLLQNLSDTSFCGLGCATLIAVQTFIKNVIEDDDKNNIKLTVEQKKTICNCFS